mgnify:FL=1
MSSSSFACQVLCLYIKPGAYLSSPVFDDQTSGVSVKSRVCLSNLVCVSPDPFLSVKFCVCLSNPFVCKSRVF